MTKEIKHRDILEYSSEWGITWTNEDRGESKGTLKEALKKADEELKKFQNGTRQDVIVYDWYSDTGAIRKWNWGKFDKSLYSSMKDPVLFSDIGWLSDWQVSNREF